MADDAAGVPIWSASYVASVASEAMSGVAEAALGEGKDFRWADSEHERGPDMVSKAILTDLVFPSPVPLLCPRCGEPVELLCVGDAGRLALDDHVEAALPVVSARGQRDARVAGEVARLLLVPAGGEVPMRRRARRRRAGSRAAGRLVRTVEIQKISARLIASSVSSQLVGCAAWIAESGVELCAGCRHHGFLDIDSRAPRN